MAKTEDIQQLVEKAQEGDRGAFGELAGLCRPYLEAVIRRRFGGRPRGGSSVDDVLQETYLRAWACLSKFEPHGQEAFLRWLAGIAVKVVLEMGRRDGELHLDADPPAADPSPSKTLQREERFVRLQEALDDISPDHRRVLQLVRLEGLSIGEAAKRMNRSPNAVSKLLVRALREVRQRFGETDSLALPPRRLEDGRPGTTGEEHEGGQGAPETGGLGTQQRAEEDKNAK
jgi:RNA polymerase sigma factor (sigma-70 family)